MPTSTGIYGENITTLATGENYVVDARNCVAVTVRVGTGATATVSAVDSATAGAHTSGAENQATVAANTFANLFSLLGPHPYYRVSVTGGSCRVAAFQ